MCSCNMGGKIIILNNDIGKDMPTCSVKTDEKDSDMTRVWRK